jgi:hypothetical protein
MAKLLALHPTRQERNATIDLSPDEILFLQACDPRWFDLDREKVSTILSAAYRLLTELLPERDTDLHIIAAEALA